MHVCVCITPICSSSQLQSSYCCETDTRKMMYQTLFFLLLISISDANHQEFVQCMSPSSSSYLKTFKYLHTPSTPSYSSLLQSAEQNPRWLNSTSPKPTFIITPFTATEIQAAIICSKKYGFQIRIKSGGHDYEGQSYLCGTPFVIIDLVTLKSISIDLEDETAWVHSGATLGELYYNIAKKSRVHGFPAGLCPSVGVGGHFSGGGFGTMVRKHGLSADNIIDAYLIDVWGEILNRESMGEDLFWAIRGGGGASFGVIIAWKIKLVRVPLVVTVFTIKKQLDQHSIKLIHKWQHIANKLPEDLFLRIIIQDSTVDDKFKKKTVLALFNSLFLGRANDLLPLMENRFPKLGLQAEDCIEMSWIQSVLYFTGYKKDEPLELLLDRTVQYKSYFKAKSDFVQKPVPETALKGIRERFLEEEIVFLIMDPYGGKMDAIPETEIPFPHRKGNLYNIQYLVKWTVDGEFATEKHINWIRMLYDYMKPYVSKYPRAAYINYRDLDLGVNEQGNTSYSKAVTWGRKYFKGNFERLARVKTKVDPENIFRNEQSIPLFLH